MPKKVLVVDDEPLVATIISRHLVAKGYLVFSACDGADLFQKLRGFRPDVILLDVMMPGMDGVKVAETLGQNPATANIPIVFISALIGPSDPQDNPANPFHHYLGKPFEPEVLLALLKRIGL